MDSLLNALSSQIVTAKLVLMIFVVVVVRGHASNVYVFCCFLLICSRLIGWFNVDYGLLMVLNKIRVGR